MKRSKLEPAIFNGQYVWFYYMFNVSSISTQNYFDQIKLPIKKSDLLVIVSKWNAIVAPCTCSLLSLRWFQPCLHANMKERCIYTEMSNMSTYHDMLCHIKSYHGYPDVNGPIHYLRNMKHFQTQVILWYQLAQIQWSYFWALRWWRAGLRTNASSENKPYVKLSSW